MANNFIFTNMFVHIISVYIAYDYYSFDDLYVLLLLI